MLKNNTTALINVFEIPIQTALQYSQTPFACRVLAYTSESEWLSF